MSEPFELVIDGMHCGACVRRVRAAVEKLPGVVVGEVAIGRVTGELDGAERAEVAAAVTAIGFTVRE